MLRAALCLLLTSGLAMSTACSLFGNRTVHNRPMLRADCYWLKVRPGQSKLARKDLLAIADLYQIKKGGNPIIDEILELNKACRVASKEEIILGSEQQSYDDGRPPCQSGWLLAPIAENRASR